MANQNHLEILRQGVDVWNSWRKENPLLMPDLSFKQFTDAFGKSTANFKGINFSDTRLFDTNLIEADLREANLSGADLRLANLKYANLTDADLSMANLARARLKNAKLRETGLWMTNFCDAYLEGTDFDGAMFDYTLLGGANLKLVKGLDSAYHSGPSFIDIHTIYISGGNIPESFLKGAGVPDNLIQYMGSLTKKAFEYYSCFISYSSKDQDFAERLYTDLQSNGIRCWFAPEDLKIGDKFRQRIDESIRIYDKLLLILSEHSINSEWVEDEVEAAYEEERKRKKTVLFPVRINDAVMETDNAWATKLRRTRHIGDFTRWKEHDQYQKAFKRLLKDLKAED